MSDKNLFINDLVARNPGFSFTETITNGIFTVAFKDGSSVTQAEASGLTLIDAYRKIRFDVLEGENLPFISTTTQRDALSGIGRSTVIDNITNGFLEKYDGSNWVNTAGSVIDSNLSISVSGTTAPTSRIRAMRFQATVNSGAGIQAGHSRGTEGSPVALNSGDELGQFVFIGDNGTNQTSAGPVIRGKTTEAWGSSAKGSHIEFAVMKNGTTVEIIGFDIKPSVVAGETYMFVYDVDNATLERVTVGAVDSGGSGFKVLRIPN